MTVQLRTQTIAQQDVLGDSQIKANSSPSTNTAELNSATATLAKTSKSLDSEALEQSTEPNQTYDDAEDGAAFVLPDILGDEKSLEVSDVLLDNEQSDTTNQDTQNELQAFIQNPRAERFKTQPIILPTDLTVQTEHKSAPNDIAPSVSNITPLSPVENVIDASSAELVEPIITQISTVSKLHDNDELPLPVNTQAVSTVMNEVAKVTISPETIEPLIQADKLILSNQQGELLVKPSGANSTVQDQYLAMRFLSENSPSNTSVNSMNHKSTTTDAINTLASSLTLHDEKDFQKGLIQQVVGSVENRDHTLSKPAFGSSADTQPVQQWRKEQLTTNTNEWGQRLLNVLSDKVSLQIGQQIQRAQIRLDPPQLGSIEIAISVEGDKTTVHLVAANAQIREAMQQTLDQLRHSLSQAGDVTVEVDVGENQQQPDNSGDTYEMDIAENTAIEEEATLKTTENSAKDWLNRLV